jgi:glutamine synthetase
MRHLRPGPVRQYRIVPWVSVSPTAQVIHDRFDPLLRRLLSRSVQPGELYEAEGLCRGARAFYLRPTPTAAPASCCSGALKLALCSPVSRGGTSDLLPEDIYDYCGKMELNVSSLIAKPAQAGVRSLRRIPAWLTRFLQWCTKTYKDN